MGTMLRRTCNGGGERSTPYMGCFVENPLEEPPAGAARRPRRRRRRRGPSSPPLRCRGRQREGERLGVVAGAQHVGGADRLAEAERYRVRVDRPGVGEQV